MSAQLPDDPQWKRAHTLLSTTNTSADLALIGVPAHLSSISPTNADQTPDAIRSALARYSTFSTSDNLDLAANPISDLGNVQSPDGTDGIARVHNAVKGLLNKHKLLIALGGDNSITYSVASGLWPLANLEHTYALFKTAT